MSQAVDPKDLKLPQCPLPRPGESVIYYSDARPISGELRGHDIKGNAIIDNQFGNPAIKRYTSIRPAEPFARKGPNWEDLPKGSEIIRPSNEQQERLNDLLNRRIHPGPRYFDLMHEIWARGFEAFLVGGTVRDVIRGEKSNDIDIVTTMPLRYLKDVVRPMFYTNEQGNAVKGFIRIGGTPNSGDPFMDVKVFSDSLQGTSDATFGVDLYKDASHRDFACNSLYYDAINQVIIDPFGYGLDDAISSRLSYVCTTGAHRQIAQIFVRIIKFSIRGYEVSEQTMNAIQTEIIACIPTLKKATLKDYVSTQILSKTLDPSGKAKALSDFKEFFSLYGFQSVYDDHFQGIVDEIEEELDDD